MAQSKQMLWSSIFDECAVMESFK